MDKNTYEIRFCELISASLGFDSGLWPLRVVVLPLRGNEYICRLSAAVIALLTFPPDTVILSRQRRISVPAA